MRKKMKDFDEVAKGGEGSASDANLKQDISRLLE